MPPAFFCSVSMPDVSMLKIFFISEGVFDMSGVTGAFSWVEDRFSVFRAEF